MLQRAAGILLPISALPGPYGMGTLGTPARQFADFLQAAGQRVWQLLPLVPADGNGSPYLSPSSAAGNPLLIDPEELAALGLVTREDLAAARLDAPDHMDHAAVAAARLPLLRAAFRRAGPELQAQAEAFSAGQSDWLPDYALFQAAKAHFGGLPLSRWPDESLRLRRPEALARYRSLLAEEIAFHTFLQFLFFRQWRQLRDYAHARGVGFLGDLPMYVSADSADVWAHPELFQRDGQLRPTRQAGVPPDSFSDQGQLWGSPLYRWGAHAQTGYRWWCRRVELACRLYDWLRIDHFRGLHSYWSVPAGAPSAVEGRWEAGPGQALLDALARQVPQAQLIAEDLGDLDGPARDFVSRSGLPGMRVLVDAFSPDGASPFLPHNCPENAVVYTSTHDTPTFIQWLFHQAPPEQRRFAMDYLRLREEEGWNWGALSAAWATVSRLAVAPLQDVLGLGADSRMNTPGTVGPHNWSWRVRAQALNPEVARRLARITQLYGRGGPFEKFPDSLLD